MPFSTGVIYGVVLGAILVPLCGHRALAQALIPTSPQGNPYAGGNTLLNSTDDVTARRHKDLTGKPCITLIGDTRPQKINPQILDHMVVAKNACGQNIKMKVCYYHSEHCISMNVPAYLQKEAVLGIMPSMRGFRFEYREQFDPFGRD
jgi:hypothetical protein